MEARTALMSGEQFVTMDGQAVSATYELIRFGSARGDELSATHPAFKPVTDWVYQDEHGIAIAPREVTGWRTYNFEVEGTHTYIAGGLRVHNWSIGDELDRLAFEHPEEFGFNQDLGYAAINEAVTFRDADGVARSAYAVDNFGRTHFLTGEAGPDGATIITRDRVVEQWGDSGREITYEVDVRRTIIGGQMVRLEDYDPDDGALLYALDYGPDGDVAAVIRPTQERVLAADIGQAFGSSLGAVLGGDSFVGRIAAGTVLGTLGQNLGEFIQKSGLISLRLTDLQSASGTPIADAFNETFRDFGSNLTTNFTGQLTSGISALLMAELSEALGLDGFEGGLFNVVGTTITNQFLTNAVGIASGQVNSATGATYTLFDGFSSGQIITNLGSAFGSYLGSYLGSQVLLANNPQAAIGTQIGSAIGSVIGSFIPIPVIGTFIGSFIGSILGTLVGNVFGADAKSWSTIYLDGASGDFVGGLYGAKNGGDAATFVGISDGIAHTVNYLVDLTGGSVAGFETGSAVGFYQKGTTYTVTEADGDIYDYSSRITVDVNAAWAGAADNGALSLLQSVELAGGDPFAVRAFENSDAGNVAAFAADIEVAKSYRFYVENTAVINALIEAQPDSQFAATWIVTLMRAQELGLNKSGRQEFAGGLSGFITSLNLGSFGATLGDVHLYQAAGGVYVDIDLRDTAVVPKALLDLYGGQAFELVTSEGRMLRIMLDAASFARGKFGGLSMAFAADGYGAPPDQASPTGAMWQSRGEENRNTAWFARNDIDNDYRDKAEYWEIEAGVGGSADALIGGDRRDVIYASNGDDWLSGGNADDSLYGEAGNDILYGDTGNDWLTGGTGADRFVFGGDFGYDSIVDFEINGGDVVEFGTAELRSFAEIMTKAHQDGADVIIEPNPETSVRIKNIQLADLRADHFAVRPAPTVSVADVRVVEGTASPANDGFLSTRGNQIVDASGQPVKITAVNWFGFESDHYVAHGLYNHTYQQMMDQMKSLGFNTIRLPFSDQLFDPASMPNGINVWLNKDLEGLTGLQIMDKFIDYAGKIGLRVILDHHRNDVGDGANADGLWYSTDHPESTWIANWQMLAQRYAGNAIVIGADLHNEPHATATWGSGDLATDWRLAAERAGNAIQAVNQDWLIFVEGIEVYEGEKYWWGGNLMGVKDHPVRLNDPSKLVYSPHDYPNSIFAQPWFSEPDFPANVIDKIKQMWGYIYESETAPIWIGEIGTDLVDPKDVLWLEKIKAYTSGDLNGDGVRDIPADKEGPSWAWWSWNPDSGDTGGILLDDWETVDPAKYAHVSTMLADMFPDFGKTTLTFTVSLSSPASELVTVAYKTVANSAVAGADFTSTAGTLTFLPGEQVKTVTTTVFRDTLSEGDQTFSLVLSDPSNAVLDKSVAIATIADDDRPLSGAAAVINDWGTGFIAEIYLNNLGATRIDQWTYQFDMPYEILEIWDAEIVGHSGSTYVVRNVAWNASIEPGLGRSFGFKATPGGADAGLIRFEHGAMATTTGTGGNDVMHATDVASAIHGGAGADEIVGSRFADLLDGGSDNDQLYGLAGMDHLYGEAGDDVLDGGAGADNLTGGTGFDLASYWNSSAGVAIDFSQTAIVGTGGEAEGDHLSSIEGVIGSAHVDTLTGDALANRLEGNGGDDYLAGGSGNDLLYGGTDDDMIYGGAGDDKLYGGTGSNLLYGGDGADELYGEDGNDILQGGAGNDKIYGNGGVDSFDGGDGDDEIYGGSSADAIDGGAGNDLIYANGGNDTVFGGAGADRIFGGDGNDKLFGGEGANLLVGGDGDDELYGEAGNDNLQGEAGNDKLYGNGGLDAFTGGAGNDEIYGGSSTDTIDAGDGDDIVYGNEGDDVVIGGNGNDTLSGWLGNDVFVYRPNFGQDAINGFIAGAGTEDVIEFDDAVFDNLQSVLAAAVQNGADTVITAGTGQTITLKEVSVTNLHADDFRFV